MKALLFLSLLLLFSCKAEKQTFFGCTDSKSIDYDPNATLDNGSCRYGGLISIYRRSNGDSLDSIQIWTNTPDNSKIRASADTSLRLKVKFPYFLLSTLPPVDCKFSMTPVNLPFGTWTYQLKKKLANGTVINLTPRKIVTVTKNFCDTLGVN